MSNSLSNWFGFGWNQISEPTELPDIFPMPIGLADFVRIDVVSIYAKILTDVLERTHGLNDDQVALMWDSCVMSSARTGLITVLAQAMADKSELFLVYEKAVGVVRLATGPEQITIRADYAKEGESKVGIFVSFKSFHRSDMVKFYTTLNYATVSALYKSMNLSKSIQLKMSDLRKSVSLADAADAKVQAQALAKALGAGRDVLLDADDEITSAVPDLSATKASVEFITQKLSFYLGLPEAYISGEQTAGIGSTGENDMRAVERGLKAYFYAVLKPVVEALFGLTVTYKSQDFRQIESASEILKTFALIDESLISSDNKRKIINQLLNLPEDAKGDPVAPVVVAPAATRPTVPPRAPAPEVVA